MNTKSIELLCYWCVIEEKKMLELRNIQAQYRVVSGNEANLSLLAVDHHPATSTCTAGESYVLSTCCECGQLEDPSSDVPILLCDGCDNHCHLPCARDRPKLTAVPEGDWYCSACAKKRTGNEIPQKVVTGSKITPIMSPSSQDESSSAIGAAENRPMDADATTTTEDGDGGGTGNDLGAGVMYVRFVGGHPSNPILRVQLPREEDNCGSATKFDLPSSGPNDAVEMSHLQQANVVDIKPLPPRQISGDLVDASTTNDVDAERAQRHKARKGVAAKIYRLLEHQPESWPQQWRFRFSELTSPQRVSFVSKLEHKLYMGSATIEGHLNMVPLADRVYDFLKKLDEQKRDQTAANATGGIAIECAFEDNEATTLHNSISPQSVMEEHTSQHQQEPHRQHSLTAAHGHPGPLPPTEHAYRQFAEKKAAAEEDQWWNSCFEKLVDYQRRCGAKALPDLNYTTNGPLTTWIRAQQTQHALKLQGLKNNMTDERELKLNSVGFNLRWSSRELAFQACVEEDAMMRAETYCRIMPSANASPTVACVLMMSPAYYSQWVKMYKHSGDYQEYKRSGAPLEIQRWPGLQKWLTHQEREHQKKLGGSPTTLTDAMEYSIFRLGIINCLTRAVQVKVSDGSIHEERIRLLVDYGKFSTSEGWHLMFDEIVAYKEKHGHFIIESSNNKTLYLWMNRQRASYSQSKLSSERMQLLYSVDFPWQKKR